MCLLPTYILSIQALEKERPYLLPADHELFAQAWFQAERYFARNADTELDTRQSLERVTVATANATLPTAVQQSTKRDPQAPLPSRE
jgi:hypothetical protein